MYRLYTQDVNRDRIEHILSRNFEGYTLIPANGAYHGKPESSLVIDLDTKDKERVVSSARDIAKVNNQDSVGIAYLPVEMEYVS